MESIYASRTFVALIPLWPPPARKQYCHFTECCHLDLYENALISIIRELAQILTY